MKSVKRIYLVRHCKASGQEKTAKLTDEGLRQSKKMVDFFFGKDVDLIISSPYERAVSTVQPLSKKLGLEIHMDDRLSERVLSPNNLVNWMDKLKDSFIDLDLKLQGGESSQEAMDRGISVINELFQREERNMIVVTHGNLLSLILKYVDESFGFEDWRALSNPDVFELYRCEETGEIRKERLWK